MSIATHIIALEAAGKLRRYAPASRWPLKRRLYLSESAVKDLEDANSASNLLGIRGYIEGALTRWTTGGLVFADDRGKPRFLKRLKPPPPEIWEIMVTEPVIHARLFCRFAEPDTLIIVTKFHTRKLLGNKGSEAWKLAMMECEKAWNSLFSAPPFVGKTIHDYVTENCDACKF